jgi:hypothetical protein
MLVQWLQIYETDLSVVMSILKALSPHFDDYLLYNVDESNIIVVARHGGLVPDPDPRVLASAELQRELRRGGIVGVEDLLSRRIGNKALLDPFVSGYPVPVNSDYFPYVDQNAARFRFLERDAVQLPKLTMLPVPFLQLALPAWSPHPLEQPPEFPQTRRDRLASHAALIADSIPRNRFNVLPGEVTALVAALDVSSETCRVGGVAEAWSLAVTNLSQRTTAFLPYEELAALWTRILSSPCYSGAAPGQLLWPNFLHAVAMRDRSMVAELGHRILEQPRGQPPDLGYVLTATSAALYGLGNHREASALVRKWIRRLPAGNEYDLALGVLAAAGNRELNARL